MNDMEECVEKDGLQVLGNENEEAYGSHEGDENDLDPLKTSENQPIPDSITCSVPVEPSVGMIFEDPEAAKSCYNAYARRNGFSIRTLHTQLSRTDKSLISVEYACSREGFPCGSLKKKTKNEPKKSETRNGCKAKMVLSRQNDHWMVRKFLTEHNHELCSPKSTLMLRGHRKITRTQRGLIDVMNNVGIPVGKIMQVLDQQNCGDSSAGYISTDVQNYLGSKRRELLKEGDAQRMFNYFLKSQSENPGFVYAIQASTSNNTGNCFFGLMQGLE